MIFVAMAAAVAAEGPPLDLELTCPGQYLDTETSTADISPTYVPNVDAAQRATITRDVMRPGTATISIHGPGGVLVYPDGTERTLTNVAANDRHITGEYVRKALFISLKWRMEIDRLTGNVRIASNAGVAFSGACSAAPTKPKF